MSVYLLDRPIVFLGECGCLVAVTFTAVDFPEFVRDHRGYRMEVVDVDVMKAMRTWCGQCRPKEHAA